MGRIRFPVTDRAGNVGATIADLTIETGPPPVWDNVLTDETIQSDVFVPAGESWLFGPNVEVEGNVIIAGRFAQRPGSTLKIVGADPDAYGTGGGLDFDPIVHKNHFGIWLLNTGILDIRGTPKVGWNRTGTDPSWLAGDELWIAPTDVGDFTPRPWFPGDPVPQVDPRVPPTEVMNVTRDIIIEGDPIAHIHIRSQLPQTIEYVTLKRMGVGNNASSGPVPGRAAIHFHQVGDASRGSVVRGVAVIDSEGVVFQPHLSHGISIIDNVSVNGFVYALWWNATDPTDDLVVDRLCVSGVHMPRAISGKASRWDCIQLGGGTNKVMRNSVASGAHGNDLAQGFPWQGATDTDSLWDFTEGNVAHNNQGAGLRFWTNDRDPHHIRNAITYRNGEGGILHGAYSNSVRWSDLLLIEDHVKLAAVSKGQRPGDGGPQRYERCVIEAQEGPAIRVTALRKRFDPDDGNRVEFIDCILRGAVGSPAVRFEGTLENPWFALFRRCGIEPDDIEFPSSIPSALNDTSILIEHEDGRNWEITVENGQRNVKEL